MTTETQTEREELQQWLTDNDQYRLLIFTEENEPLKKLRQAKKVTEALDVVLGEATRKILAISGMNPSMGIGDTETDEAIVGQLYGLIH